MIYREAARKLARLGCREIPRSGGWRSPEMAQSRNQCSTVLPDHGGKDLKFGTLRAAVRQLGLDWTAFEQA